MELQEPRFTAATLFSFERTPSAVALPHFTPYRRGNVTRRGRHAAQRSGTVRQTQLGPLELRHQQAKCPFHNDCGIAIRHDVPQQILCPPQLVIGFPTDGDLDLVSLWRNRLHLRRAWRRGDTR